MNSHSQRVLAALFLVCMSMLPFQLSAEEAASSTSSSIVDTVWSGAVQTWDFGKSLGSTLTLLGSDSIQDLKIPVLGIKVASLVDSWGDARSNGRSHEGIDILAPRGTPIISPTKAVVSQIGYGANGGNYVYTINPGGERFYYAHLDSYAEGLVKGKVLEAGDVIGHVGNTGNASGGPTHLHFGIYKNGASNPYPRITVNWTSEELTAIKANMSGISVSVGEAAKTDAVGSLFVRNLTLGSQGEDVRKLQQFLNARGAVVARSGLGSPGNETTYFGPATKAALAVYQAKKSISPSSGYFGPLTRAAIQKDNALAMK